MFGYAERSSAAGGQCDNGLGLNLTGNLAGGPCGCVVYFTKKIILRFIKSFVMGQNGFRFQYYFNHHLDCLNRVLPDGGFLGEHHGIGSIQHSICDIRGFCSGGGW